MSYEQLAYIYDQLMKDVPYHLWVEFLQKEKARHRIQGNRVLDLACGTGELSLLLIKEGLKVTGVDLSSNMLLAAREKAEQLGVELPLFEQNMAELEGLGIYNLITIFCDSLNYLRTPEDVQQTFRRVFDHLEHGGLFIFDVHSPYKMTEVFANETFTLNEEDISYIWECFPGEFDLAVEHELTFFVKDSLSGKYDKFEEFHFQRTYPIPAYKTWLTESGFSIQSITGDFTNLLPDETTERIFFVCKK